MSERTYYTRLIQVRPVFRQAEPGAWPRDEAALLLNRARLARIEEWRAAADGAAETSVTPEDVDENLAQLSRQMGGLLDKVAPGRATGGIIGARRFAMHEPEPFGEHMYRDDGPSEVIGMDWGFTPGTIVRVQFGLEQFFDCVEPLPASVVFRVPNEGQRLIYNERRLVYSGRGIVPYRDNLSLVDKLYEELRVDSWNEPPDGLPSARMEFRKRALDMLISELNKFIWD